MLIEEDFDKISKRSIQGCFFESSGSFQFPGREKEFYVIRARVDFVCGGHPFFRHPGSLWDHLLLPHRVQKYQVPHDCPFHWFLSAGNLFFNPMEYRKEGDRKNYSPTRGDPEKIDEPIQKINLFPNTPPTGGKTVSVRRP